MISTVREILEKRRGLALWFLMLFPSVVLVTSKFAAVYSFGSATAAVNSANISRMAAQNTIERALDSLRGKPRAEVARVLGLPFLPGSTGESVSMPEDASSRRMLDAISDSGATPGQGLVDIRAGLNPVLGEQAVAIQDPQSGCQYQVYFPYGVMSSYSRVLVPPPLALLTSSWDNFYEIRMVISVVALIAWLIAICVVVVMWFTYRRHTGREAVLSFAILYALNALMSGAHDTIITDNPFDYRIYVGFGMVIVGMLLFAAHDPSETESRVRVAPCGVCGYDLTGNISGICPECGTPLPTRWWLAVAKAMGTPLDGKRREEIAPAAKNDRPA